MCDELSKYEDPFDAYLDGRLQGAAREQFEAKFGDRSTLQENVELQEQMDSTMRRLFSVPECPASFVDQLETWTSKELVDSRRRSTRNLSNGHLPGALLAAPARDVTPTTKPQRDQRYVAALTAIAATVAWLAVCWQFLWRTPAAPVFAKNSLANIYLETVQAGFVPYYDCSDPERFAAVFKERQQQPLRLAQLPPNRRMLGLSYPGGLSRETTAMLCEVNNKPVMVFIERLERDDPIAIRDVTPNLHVFRQRLGPLVLYEVTPWDSAFVMDALELR